jgi:hypothetical protein
MRKIGTWLIGSGIAGLATLALTAAPASAKTPTCSGTLSIANHGQHVVGDYVTRIGHDALGWPPGSGEVGSAVSGNPDAPLTPGGPGPGFHFPNGFSAGASFCLDQSQSPGTHLGP